MKKKLFLMFGLLLTSMLAVGILTGCGTPALTLTATPADFGTVSGGGNFAAGTEVQLTAEALDANYVFLGWYDGYNQVSADAAYKYTMPKKSITLEGRFDKKEYALSLNALDQHGTAVTGAALAGAGNYKWGASVSITAAVPTGYTFIGWYGGETKKYDTAVASVTMPKSNYALLARYEATGYAVAITGGVADKATAGIGETVTLAHTESRPGELFTGWEVKQTTGGAAVTMATTNTFVMPAADVTVTPKYTTIDYTITLSDEFGTYAGTPRYGETITLTYTGSAPEKGEEQVWFVKHAMGDNALLEMVTHNTFVMPDDNLIITSIIRNITYAINFDDNDASYQGIPEYLEIITLIVPDSMPAGTAGLWAVTRDDTGEAIQMTGTDTFVMPDCDVTVTAVFKTRVTIFDVPGVIAARAEDVPVTTYIETDEYTGTISWHTGDATGAEPTIFAWNTTYTAVITLTLKSGFTFYGIAGNTFTVAGCTEITHAANSGILTVTFNTDAIQRITDRNIVFTVTPVVNAAVTTPAIDQTQYTGTVAWYVGSTSAGATPAVFLDVNPQYTVVITLTAKYGYTFQGVAANFFRVNQVGTLSQTGVTNPQNSGVVTRVFPASPTQITTANATDRAIPGITAPVAWAVPSTPATITKTGYTGTIVWRTGSATGAILAAGDTFAANTVYVAQIVLTAKYGYRFNSLSANLFTVNSIATTHTAMSANVFTTPTITVTFPTTGAAPNPVSLTALTIAAPVAGETASTTAIDNDEYTTVIEWFAGTAAHMGVFAYNTIYRVRITVIPKAGYTLRGVAANTFTINGVVVPHVAGADVFEYTFLATAADPN